ncbi:MAG: helicase-exonuclease AddAB subunit AddB [Bacillota bacterium]
MDSESKLDCASRNKHPLILIVPEQFSLQAEKNLAKISAFSGVPRAEALSFRRMAFRVFSEVGGITRRRLNVAGKRMMLFRIMKKLEKELRIYSKAAFRKGFTEALSDAIMEFKRCDVAPEQLAETAEKLADGLPLKDKLRDLALIYSEFEKQMQKDYMDADDDLTELCNKLDKSVQFNGAEIWIDEFSGFTSQEYKVIGKLLKKASRVTVCLCTDSLPGGPGDESASMLFEPVRKTAVKLLRLAEKEGIEVEKPVRLGAAGMTDVAGASGMADVPGVADVSGMPELAGVPDMADTAGTEGTADMSGKTGLAGMTDVPGVSPRFSESEELAHLEKNIYKYPYEKYNKSSGDVCICASANPYLEVEECARDIIKLCRDRGYRYRNIAVTMRNPDSYESIIKSVFTRYGIPFFLDGKRDIDSHPLIVFILSALDIFINNWNYESVFRYARTGFSGVDREELDLLENYVLANGIRGNAWTREDDWDYPVEALGDDDRLSDRDMTRLEIINAARRKLAGPLISFRGKTKGGARAVEFCTALYELLRDTGADKRIDEQSRSLAAKGLLEQADEYRQVWNIIMDVFSQIVEVLGEESIGTERFSEILAAGFSGYKIGLIPPALDQVLAGNIERARNHDIKALCILGVNEGVLPGGKGNEGLLSDIDRDSLENIGLELAGNSKSHCLEERFMIYMAFATPSRHLRLSYPAADRDGRALRPSHVISEIKRILPRIVERSTVAGMNQDRMPGLAASGLTAPDPVAPKPTFDEMAAQLRRRYDGKKIHDGWRIVYKWFSGQESWKDMCAGIIDGLNHTNRAERLTGDRAFALYGKPLFTSVSRMESYAACPFSFYVKYGLRAKERRIFKFDPVDAGTFMHEIINEFSRMLVKKGISWRNLDAEWCEQQVSELVDRWLSKYGNSILKSSRRYLYISGRLKKIVTKAIMLISRHIALGSFEPSGYEVEFGENGRYPPIVIELPDGRLVKMTGRIDRIDSMTGEEGTYIRIIDYKSGNRELELGDIYHGLQLQLLTYLDAVMGNEEDPAGGRSMLPAGVLYFKLDDPLIRCSRDSTDEEIEKSVMKQLRMKGLVLADVKVVREMDRQIDGYSLIIPARVNKDGSLGKSSAATHEQFMALRRYVRKVLADIAKGIMDGDVAISPYKKKTMTACKYCGFRPVCRFDTSFGDNRYRVLADYKDDELWKLMTQ